MAVTPELVYFYPEGHEAHQEYGHPERPERLEAIRSGLKSAGFWDPYPKLAPQPVSLEFLQYVHHRDYLARLKMASQRGAHLDTDTYTTPATWDLALQAAGGAMAVASAVWDGQDNRRLRGFALTRPPGHHARSDRGMGFCLLNNIALAAEYLLREGGAQRLAIIDLDLHHGNGTQQIFWSRPEVFFFSAHQSPFYPGTGLLSERGGGPGLGTKANLPLPAGTGDPAYDEMMGALVLPLLERFQPEMILISVGFDVHWKDPLGYLQLSAGCYHDAIASLVSFADENCRGRIALFLEGGYDLEAGAVCAQACSTALLGQEFSDPLGPSPDPGNRAWRDVLRQALAIWGLPD